MHTIPKLRQQVTSQLVCIFLAEMVPQSRPQMWGQYTQTGFKSTLQKEQEVFKISNVFFTYKNKVQSQ